MHTDVVGVVDVTCYIRDEFSYFTGNPEILDNAGYISFHKHLFP
jgi:hypothetical protein